MSSQHSSSHKYHNKLLSKNISNEFTANQLSVNASDNVEALTGDKPSVLDENLVQCKKRRRLYSDSSLSLSGSTLSGEEMQDSEEDRYIKSFFDSLEFHDSSHDESFLNTYSDNSKASLAINMSKAEYKFLKSLSEEEAFEKLKELINFSDALIKRVLKLKLLRLTETQLFTLLNYLKYKLQQKSLEICRILFGRLEKGKNGGRNSDRLLVFDSLYRKNDKIASELVQKVEYQLESLQKESEEESAIDEATLPTKTKPSKGKTKRYSSVSHSSNKKPTVLQLSPEYTQESDSEESEYDSESTEGDSYMNMSKREYEKVKASYFSAKTVPNDSTTTRKSVLMNNVIALFKATKGVNKKKQCNQIERLARKSIRYCSGNNEDTSLESLCLEAKSLLESFKLRTQDIENTLSIQHEQGDQDSVQGDFTPPSPNLFDRQKRDIDEMSIVSRQSIILTNRDPFEPFPNAASWTKILTEADLFERERLWKGQVQMDTLKTVSYNPKTARELNRLIFRLKHEQGSCTHLVREIIDIISSANETQECQLLFALDIAFNGLFQSDMKDLSRIWIAYLDICSSLQHISERLSAKHLHGLTIFMLFEPLQRNEFIDLFLRFRAICLTSESLGEKGSNLSVLFGKILLSDQFDDNFFRFSCMMKPNSFKEVSRVSPSLRFLEKMISLLAIFINLTKGPHISLPLDNLIDTVFYEILNYSEVDTTFLNRLEGILRNVSLNLSSKTIKVFVGKIIQSENRSITTVLIRILGTVLHRLEKGAPLRRFLAAVINQVHRSKNPAIGSVNNLFVHILEYTDKALFHKIHQLSRKLVLNKLKSVDEIWDVRELIYRLTQKAVVLKYNKDFSRKPVVPSAFVDVSSINLDSLVRSLINHVFSNIDRNDFEKIKEAIKNCDELCKILFQKGSSASHPIILSLKLHFVMNFLQNISLLNGNRVFLLRMLNIFSKWTETKIETSSVEQVNEVTTKINSFTLSSFYPLQSSPMKERTLDEVVESLDIEVIIAKQGFDKLINQRQQIINSIECERQDFVLIDDKVLLRCRRLIQGYLKQILLARENSFYSRTGYLKVRKVIELLIKLYIGLSSSNTPLDATKEFSWTILNASSLFVQDIFKVTLISQVSLHASCIGITSNLSQRVKNLNNQCFLQDLVVYLLLNFGDNCDSSYLKKLIIVRLMNNSSNQSTLKAETMYLLLQRISSHSKTDKILALFIEVLNLLETKYRETEFHSKLSTLLKGLAINTNGVIQHLFCHLNSKIILFENELSRSIDTAVAALNYTKGILTLINTVDKDYNFLFSEVYKLISSSLNYELKLTSKIVEKLMCFILRTSEKAFSISNANTSLFATLIKENGYIADFYASEENFVSTLLFKEIANKI